MMFGIGGGAIIMKAAKAERDGISGCPYGTGPKPRTKNAKGNFAMHRGIRRGFDLQQGFLAGHGQYVS
jgi:hypothetical protein